MTASKKTTISRSVGQFIGHIVRGIRSDGAGTGADTVHRRTHSEVEDRGDVVLRRTVIEEIELKDDQSTATAEGERPCP